jgi:hypothetical protein
MKKDVTYITADKIEALIAESDLRVTELRNWLKVHGEAGRRLYVPKTRRVGTIELANFEGLTHPGIVDLGEGDQHGSVNQAVDFTLPEDQVLDAVRAALEHLATMPAMEPKARKRGPRGQRPELPPPPSADRIAEIRRVAKEMGVPVSEAIELQAEDQEQDDLTAI